MHLAPDAIVTPHDVARAKPLLVRDAGWASIVGALYGGVILIGFAIQLDASPITIGLLAAIPFLAQVAQIPGIALVERLRARRRITVVAATAARALILALALLPWVDDRGAQLALLLAAQLAVALLGAFAACALNSWLHQLLAGEGLGALFSRRLFWSTVLGALAALAAGQLVERWPWGDTILAYSVIFAIAGAAGFVSSRYLALTPEPEMHSLGGARLPILAMIRAPFGHPNFRSVIVFMGAWNFASNLAAPFLAVYLMRQLGYGLDTVTALWMSSQAANALTLYLWGRLSDRLSNKAILAVALPVWFGSLLALPFAAFPAPHLLTLPLLYLLHIVLGAAGGGIALATGNLGLKLAPQPHGTSYLATVSLVGSLAAGVAAILGGLLAHWFAAHKLALTFHWSSPAGTADVTVLQFQHWEFLFALASALGLYVLHALSRIREGEDISERVVVQEFLLEAGRTFDQLSSIESSPLAVMFPFGRLLERRRKPRLPP